MKRVLVTGATGFIGHYVIGELLKGGHEVTATSAHYDKAKEKPWFGHVQYIPFDLANFSDGTDYFRYWGEPDHMIHLAWEGLPNYKAPFHLDVNLPRHLSLLTNMVRNGLKDLTVTGTCFEYGMQDGCLREDLPALPANPYAQAKDALRKGLEALQAEMPFAFKWPRLFYMYGKGQGPNSLMTQLEAAVQRGDAVFNMSGGEQVRDFLPVEEMARRICRIALQDVVQGVINCCSGVPVTVKQLVLDYLAQKNASIQLNLGYYPYPDFEPMAFWDDARKLELAMGERILSA